MGPSIVYIAHVASPHARRAHERLRVELAASACVAYLTVQKAEVLNLLGSICRISETLQCGLNSCKLTANATLLQSLH